MNSARMHMAILLSMVLMMAACADEGMTTPPGIPVDRLLAAPDTIEIGSRRIFLTTYMWRDFMPISPPNGKPLIAIAYVTAADSALLPASIVPDALYIVHNNQVWTSWFTNEPRPPGETKPNIIMKLAREGPAWGPHIYVDVIVRVHDGAGATHLLRASRQWISRTE